MTNSTPLLANLGRILFGLAGIVFGAIGLFFHDYAAVWQPIENLIGDYNRMLYASVFAGFELAAGAAILWRRTAHVGALALSALYLVCAIGWIPRIVGNADIYGVYNGLFEQLALVAAGIAIYGSVAPLSYESKARMIRAGCLLFGLCAVSFAFGHFTAIPETAAFTPQSIPLGPTFWAWATGVFHLLAGVAIISGVMATIAARLLTLMMFGFGALVWAPMLIGKPGDHFMWAGNAINFALMASAWVVADRVGRS